MPTSSAARICSRDHISPRARRRCAPARSRCGSTCSTRPLRTCLCSAERTSSLGRPCIVVRVANGSVVQCGIGRFQPPASGALGHRCSALRGRSGAGRRLDDAAARADVPSRRRAARRPPTWRPATPDQPADHLLHLHPAERRAQAVVATRAEGQLRRGLLATRRRACAGRRTPPGRGAPRRCGG